MLQTFGTCCMIYHHAALQSRFTCPSPRLRPLLSRSQEIIINRYYESRYSTSAYESVLAMARALVRRDLSPWRLLSMVYRVKGVFALTAFSTGRVTCCNREKRVPRAYQASSREKKRKEKKRKKRKKEGTKGLERESYASSLNSSWTPVEAAKSISK